MFANAVDRPDLGNVGVGEDPVTLGADTVEQRHVTGQRDRGHDGPHIHGIAACLQKFTEKGMAATRQTVRTHTVYKC